MVAVLEVMVTTGDKGNKTELIEIPASEILDEIQKNKPVKHNSVIIKGDIDISKLNLPKEKEKILVDSPIEIINSQVQGIVNFGNAKLNNRIDFRSTHFDGVVNFNEAMFSPSLEREAYLERAVYSERAVEKTIAIEILLACFEGAEFNRDANFGDAIFKRYAEFSNAVFRGNVYFGYAEFSQGADFRETTFDQDADFRETTFSQDVRFKRATFIKGPAFVGTEFKNAFFERVKFGADATFLVATFNGDYLTFRKAKFSNPYWQETVCRKAKKSLDNIGDKEESDENFYLEMEAKRIQKGIREDDGGGLRYLLHIMLKTETWSFWRWFWYDAIEWLFVQVIFGYGVHFERLVASWIVIVLLFAGLYYRSDAILAASGWFDYLKVSFATAIAPGYLAVIINPGNSTGYKIASGYCQAAAMLETLLGTFLWAGFIATFAKKYMR